MHEMRPIAIDDLVVWRVSQSVSVSLSGTRLRLAKRAKRIKVLFGKETVWEPKAHCVIWGGGPIALDEGLDASTRWGERVGEIFAYCATFPTHSPDGATFDAASTKLLWPLI